MPGFSSATHAQRTVLMAEVANVFPLAPGYTMMRRFCHTGLWISKLPLSEFGRALRRLDNMLNNIQATDSVQVPPDVVRMGDENGNLVLVMSVWLRPDDEMPQNARLRFPAHRVHVICTGGLQMAARLALLASTGPPPMFQELGFLKAIGLMYYFDGYRPRDYSFGASIALFSGMRLSDSVALQVLPVLLGNYAPDPDSDRDDDMSENDSGDEESTTAGSP